MSTKFIEHLRGGHQVYKTVGIISNTLDDLANFWVLNFDGSLQECSDSL